MTDIRLGTANTRHWMGWVRAPLARVFDCAHGNHWVCALNHGLDAEPAVPLISATLPISAVLHPLGLLHPLSLDKAHPCHYPPLG